MNSDADTTKKLEKLIKEMLLKTDQRETDHESGETVLNQSANLNRFLDVQMI